MDYFYCFRAQRVLFVSRKVQLFIWQEAV